MGRRDSIRWALACAGLLSLPWLARGRSAAAQVAPEQLAVLRRGLNITNWFRFPVSLEARRLRGYLSDEAISEIRQAGFTFVRLCIQPQVMLRGDVLEPERLPVLLEAVQRLQRAGLGVMVDAHPEEWDLEGKPADRKAMFDFWRALAPALRRFDPGLTFIEIMNEPVFRNQAAWAALQEELLAVIRASLPGHAVVLTGADWGSLEGLLALRPVRDARVIYSVHDYTPRILTTFAPWEQGMDAAALARLPFPVTDLAACRASVAGTPHHRTREVGQYYCAEAPGPGQLRERMGRAAAWGRQHGAPVMLLEFGAHARLNKDARLAYLRAIRQAAEQEGMGWAFWGYGDIMGFPAQPGAGRVPLDGDTLRALGLAGG